MKANILARSSSGDSYVVEFSDDSMALRVFCHCPAGSLQQMCKHKLALIKLDAKMLFDAAQEPLLQQIRGWPSYNTLLQRISRYESELKELEKEKSRLMQREKQLKSELAYEVTHGRQKA